MNISMRIKMFLTSSFVLVAFSCALANNYKTYTLESSSFVMPFLKETQSDKNISNVKVSYSPIAEQINVSFKLSKQTVVSIKLMDALGNEVMNLANATLEEGTHSLSFETAGKVPAGFYFLRVFSGLETVVKRVSIR